MLLGTDMLFNWLKSIKFDEYYTLFQQAAYDLPTISRMTPEDLTAIGITKPKHRRKLKIEINKLNILDGIPNYRPDSLDEWLRLIRLDEYSQKLKEQDYSCLEKVVEITWEDLEEIGIKKLGHQKRIMLAIKKLQSIFAKELLSTTNGRNNPTSTTNLSSHSFDQTIQSQTVNHYLSASSLQSSTNLNSSLNSLSSSHSTSTSKSSNILHSNLYLPLQNQCIYGTVQNTFNGQPYQEVAINTNHNRNSTKLNLNSPNEFLNGNCSNNTSLNSNTSIHMLTTNTPATPELKTFQQISTSNSTCTTNAKNSTTNCNLTDNNSINSSSSSLTFSLNNSSNSAMIPSQLVFNGTYHAITANNNHIYQLQQQQLIQQQNSVNNQQQLNLQQPIVVVSRGRSMESLQSQQTDQVVYALRPVVLVDTDKNQNAQIINSLPNNDQCQVQAIYGNNTINFINQSELDGTSTLNRPKNLIKNRPVAKIVAKTRDQLLNENNLNINTLNENTDSIMEQKQALGALQIYDNLPFNSTVQHQQQQQQSKFNNINCNVLTNNLINANLNQNLVYVEKPSNLTIYDRNVYFQNQQSTLNDFNQARLQQQDRNSYIYATLKRKKVPPPIPKRTNSMRSNGSQLPLTAPSTPSAFNPTMHVRRGSLDDAQTLLTQQLNQLALAQQLKQQLNHQRCSSLEVMQEEAFATCVKSLTSRFSMDANVLDDVENLPPPPPPLISTFVNEKTNLIKQKSDKKHDKNSTNEIVQRQDNYKMENKEKLGIEDNLKTQTTINKTTVINLNLINKCDNQKKEINIKQEEDNNLLNQSQNSDDFPPPPSPLVLETTNNHTRLSPTPPLPPPPSPPTTPPPPLPPSSSSSSSLTTLTQSSLSLKEAENCKSNLDSTLNKSINSKESQTLFDNLLNSSDQQTNSHQRNQNSVPSNLILNNNINQVNLIQNEDCKQFQNTNAECSVSSSSSTESMPFANDNIGTIRPKPNSCNLNLCELQQQMKNFSMSTSSSCSSSISSSTSSSLSSSSSLASTPGLNYPPNLIGSQSNCSTVLPNIVTQQQPQLDLNKTVTSNAPIINTNLQSSNQTLKPQFNSNKIIQLSKPIQPPQVSNKPSNWPCSPVKQLLPLEMVPNVNQIKDVQQTMDSKFKNDLNKNENLSSQQSSPKIKNFDKQCLPSKTQNKFTVNFDKEKTSIVNSKSSEFAGADVMDDIEAMLANLSTQLDAMLEKEIEKK